MRNRSQKTAETLLLEPTKNKEKKSPQARQTFAQRKTWKPASHQAKLKKKVFGTRMRKGRTPAGFVPKPLRNRSRKNAETSLLEPIKKRKKYRAQTMRNRSQKTAETLLLEKTCKPPGQTQEKGVWDALRKGRTPAGFVPKPLRNRSRKNAETSLLEPIRKKDIYIYAQTMRNRSQKTKKMPNRESAKRCFWNLLKTKKKVASSKANLCANSRKRCLGRACEKAEPQQVLCPSHCETAAGKMPKRRSSHQAKLKKKVFGTRSLKTKKKSRLKQGKPLRNVRLGSLQATRPNSRKRCLGRACEKAEPQQVLCPSHCETVAGKMPKRRCWNPLKRERNRAQTMRNRSQKTAETLLLDPTKNKEKTCKPPGQTQEKGVWDARAKRQNPSRFCAQAIAKPQPKKCRNVAVGAH